jgi:cyanophycinase-like exopeptidase
MKKITLLFLLIPIFLFSQNYTSYFTGNPTDVTTNHQFGICLMGGATESDEAMIWFLEKADGGDILVLRASGSDGYNNYFYSQLGVTVNSVETLVIHNADGAIDPYVLQKVAQAEAIWIAGGNQWNYVNYFKGNAMQDALNHHVNVKQAVIGGTSAGMAILGSYYFDAQNGTVNSAQALINPYAANVSLGYNDFLEIPYLENVVTDTHYDNPDRRGRHTVFLARMTTDHGVRSFGIASEEYTAVCIEPDGTARVFGEYPSFQDFAYFLQANCTDEFEPETCVAGLPLHWQRENEAVKVYKVPGTVTGENYFELDYWENGSGGTWEHWYVENGNFIAEPGIPIDCSIVSVEDHALNNLIMTPNPVTDVLQIIYDQPFQLEVYNILGQKIINKEKDLHKSIDFSSQRSGVYFVKATGESGSKVFKVTKM